jgi:hypothetical protein
LNENAPIIEQNIKRFSTNLKLGHEISVSNCESKEEPTVEYKIDERITKPTQSVDNLMALQRDVSINQSNRPSMTSEQRRSNFVIRQNVDQNAANNF